MIRIKKIVLIFLLPVFSNCYSQLDSRFKEIVSGNLDIYKSRNIKEVVLLRNDTIIKKINYSNNNLQLNDIKNSEIINFTYDDKKRLAKLERQNITVSFKYIDDDTTPTSISAFTKGLDYDTLQNTIQAYRNRMDIFNNELFIFNKQNDTTNMYHKSTVINEKDNNWSYTFYRNKNYSEKIYNNGTSIKEEFSPTVFRHDSTIYVNKRHQFYRTLVYKDSTIDEIIRNDSNYIKVYINGKLFKDRLLYKHNIQFEDTYSENGIKSTAKKYYYLPDKFNNLVLWEIITTSNKNKVTDRAYPNKKYYKKRKNILYVKKIQERELLMCPGFNFNFIRIKNHVWILSPSILSNTFFENVTFGNYPLKERMTNYFLGRNQAEKEILYESIFISTSKENNKFTINDTTKTFTLPYSLIHNPATFYQISYTTNYNQSFVSNKFYNIEDYQYSPVHFLLINYRTKEK